MLGYGLRAGLCGPVPGYLILVDIPYRVKIAPLQRHEVWRRDHVSLQSLPSAEGVSFLGHVTDTGQSHFRVIISIDGVGCARSSVSEEVQRIFVHRPNSINRRVARNRIRSRQDLAISIRRPPEEGISLSRRSGARWQGHRCAGVPVYLRNRSCASVKIKGQRRRGWRYPYSI